MTSLIDPLYLANFCAGTFERGWK